jgi:hypothetical protein
MYSAIAAAIAQAREEAPSGFSDAAIDRTAEYIADVFAEESDRFDRERFLKAAGAA